MKVFVIGSGIPHRRGNEQATAIHVQLYAFLRALRASGHDAVLQLILVRDRTSPTLKEAEQAKLADVEARLGITVLPPLLLWDGGLEGVPRRENGRVGRFLRVCLGRLGPATFYPALQMRDEMHRRIQATGADGVLMVASPEGVAATYGIRHVPKVAFQGDVDFIPTKVRLQDREGLFQGGEQTSRAVLRCLRQVTNRRFVRQFRDIHVRLMSDVDVIANATAANVGFYERCGHPRSVYVGTTWPDPDEDHGARVAGAASVRRLIKIIGHLGHLDNTGTTYGLRFLLVELMPVLRTVMQGLEYQVHIIGPGEVVPKLRRWVQQEGIIMRGYVDALDAELQSSDVFLFLNNAGPLLAAYSRHVIAWAMRLCLVVHANSRRAIPEIAHMENALVGATPHELAHLVRAAATDHGLNQRIREGGRRTYEQRFRPSVLAAILMEEMERPRPTAA